MLNRYGIGVRINGVDVGNVVIVGGRIERGRLDVVEQPQPDTLSLEVFTRDGWPQNPQAWFEYGASDNTTAASGFDVDHDTQDTYLGPPTWLGIDSDIHVSLTTDTGFSLDHDTQDVYDGAEYRRFTGKISAFDYTYERLSIFAVSGLEAWARRAIMTQPSFSPPTDSTDVDLAQWLCAVTPAPTTLHVDGAEGPLMLNWAKDDYPLCLLDELRAIATQADALIYAKRDGNVTYQTRLWDHGDPYSIPPETVDVDGLAMSMELGLHRNKVMVEYGVQPTSGTPPVPSGDKPTVTAQNPAGLAYYGPRQEFAATRLADVAGATDHAETLVNLWPMEWAMPDVTCRMILATSAQTEQIEALDLGHRVQVNPLPLGAPVNVHIGEIIGYSEFLSSEDWQIEFHLGPPYTRVTGS